MAVGRGAAQGKNSVGASRFPAGETLDVEEPLLVLGSDHRGTVFRIGVAHEQRQLRREADVWISLVRDWPDAQERQRQFDHAEEGSASDSSENDLFPERQSWR